MLDLTVLRLVRDLITGKRLRGGDLLGPQEAVRALCARGIRVTPCGDDFQHWQVGDFLMTDADLIRFAVSRGLL